MLLSARHCCKTLDGVSSFVLMVDTGLSPLVDGDLRVDTAYRKGRFAPEITISSLVPPLS